MTDFYVAMKEILSRELLELPNVNLVGIGFKNGVPGEKCIVVGVEKKLPVEALPYNEIVPNRFGDVKTDVVETGRIDAGYLKRTDKWRPAPGGVSIGHYKISAGTLGTVVYDKFSGSRYLLSNNHVFANSNDALVGDAILQPGPYDGGKIEDQIAILHRYCPIDFGEDTGTCPIAKNYAKFGNFVARLVGSKHRVNFSKVNSQAINSFDAAIAKPISQVNIDPAILGIGEITDVDPFPYLGQRVAKSGRTTEYTEGNISAIHATVRVSYGSGKIATFQEQLVAGAMSAGGDSGSLVISVDSVKAVGLLFAGSDATTIFSPIQPVLDYFNVEFVDA